MTDYNSRQHFLAQALASRLLVLDGSLGVSFQQLHLSESDMRGTQLASHPCSLSGNFDILNITAPYIVEQIHTSFLEAGADIIETNTFNAQTLSQERYATAHLVERMNTCGARIARRLADKFTASNPSKPRFVAGSIGPTAHTLSMSDNIEDAASRRIDFEQMSRAMQQQAEALIRGGVDFLLVETIFDALNVKATLDGIDRARRATGIDIPVALSVTLSDASHRLLTGMTPEAFLAALAHVRPMALGFNCSGAPASLVESVERLNRISPFPTILYPNAGLPDETGRYSESPDTFVDGLLPLIKNRGLNIVGGCCGTTPAHIARLAEVAADAQPRIAGQGDVSWLAGLEPFDPRGNGFVNVGERCNVAGSRKFLRLIKEKSYAEALEIAAKQVADGAMILDLNFDDAMLDSRAEMVHFLRLLASDPRVASVPWMIDSSSFDVIEAALENIGGKPIVNSISLKHGEDEFLRQAEIIRRAGAGAVVMLFDEEGQAVTFDHKIRVARRAYSLLTGHGWNPRDIIIDANILTVATGIEAHVRYAIDFIEAVEWVKQNLPGARTSGGVSNISFAFRGNNYIRRAIHSVFLYHAMRRGLDMAIVDPAGFVAYDDIPGELVTAIEDVILCRRPDATDRLISLASVYTGADVAAAPAAVSAVPDSVENRLEEALVRGNVSAIEDDIKEAMRKYGNPSIIINDILMAAMEKVGALFADGKMFLPQVVKSARCMHVAVEFLTPYMNASAGQCKTKGKFVIATVKGDVHDIGKNIAAVVMRCNGFEVVDLGVQVDASAIVDAVHRYNPDFIGLSGLIAPSLNEMAITLRALHQAGISIPVFIGGAAASALHTAVKLSPDYPDGVVIYVADASQNPLIASRLLADYAAEAEEIRARIEQLILEHESSVARRDEAVCERIEIDWTKEEIVPPSFMGCREVDPIPVSEIIPYINWRYFLNCWRTAPDTAEAEELLTDAKALVSDFGNYSMRARVGFFKATPGDEAILIEGRSVPTPRQKSSPQRRVRLSLADFLSPHGDYVGAFCVTVGDELRAALKENADPFRQLLIQSVCDRLAEAASEYLHRQVRTSLWGYVADEPFDLAAILRGKYRGIRPAVGYGCLPDQSAMHTVGSLLNVEEMGVEITVNGALNPASSVAGFYFASPHARYFTQ